MNLPWVFLKYRNTIDFCVLKINYCLNFPGGSDGKSVCLQYGRPGFNPWIRKILWRRKWQPTPVLLPGKSHGWRSVVCYSPRGRKESDMTERLHFTLQVIIPANTFFPLHIVFIYFLIPFFHICRYYPPHPHKTVLSLPNLS